MTKNQNFFSYEKKAAAVLKHAVLRRYLGSFAGKLSHKSKPGYLDGYAGSGRYVHAGGLRVEEGSPVIALRIAADTGIVCSFVEKDKPTYASLASVVAEFANPSARTYQGAIADHLDTVLKRFEGEPLLVFLDPFGTALDTQTTVDKILNRPGLASTELLLNFSEDSVRRIGARYFEKPSAKGRAASLERMNRWLGGNWWQQLFADALKQHGRAAAAREAAAQVTSEYTKRIRQASSCNSFSVPVQRRPGHLPIFRLILFYKSAHALIPFNTAASMGVKEWREHEHQRALGDAAKRDITSPRLYGLSHVEELEQLHKAETADLERGLVEEIKGSIDSALATAKQLSVQTDFAKVYGKTIGRARETHLRTAWKELASEGKTTDCPKGKLDRLTISRP